MQLTQAHSATLAGWRSKLIGVIRPAVTTRRVVLAEAPRRGATQAAVANRVDARTAAAADAILRSPLALDLSADSRLAIVARNLDEDEISEAAVRLVREHGLMLAKSMIAEDPTVLSGSNSEDVAIFKALQVGILSRALRATPPRPRPARPGRGTRCPLSAPRRHGRATRPSGLHWRAGGPWKP
ncbi:hypothetical protein MNEG_9567 [Monoraphidium neglectum]|uniref:Uncharacterized protein n=1 Tax=Monoraphidium neglectum TaxID=145388 RepID=A0A0D2MC35_9CHLO|nr:hypothetical protein MNEG_9567 [Monoraphidium neglectum]KIY98396.1 hypothetical protein MNEG_9567 [Monoraphidium neglectum]|eukprot:XP_013897416.1 hypothetical protein MNEG_9567 [Monoraphidium neglectum]